MDLNSDAPSANARLLQFMETTAAFIATPTAMAASSIIAPPRSKAARSITTPSWKLVTIISPTVPFANAPFKAVTALAMAAPTRSPSPPKSIAIMRSESTCNGRRNCSDMPRKNSRNLPATACSLSHVTANRSAERDSAAAVPPNCSLARVIASA